MSKNYKNKEIRKAVIEADITIGQLAKALEYSYVGFSRLLKDELPTDEKHIVLHTIDEIAYGFGEQYTTDRLKLLRAKKGNPKKIRRANNEPTD